MKRFMIAPLALAAVLAAGAVVAAAGQPTASTASVVNTPPPAATTPAIPAFATPTPPPPQKCFGGLHSHEYCQKVAIRHRITKLRKATKNLREQHGLLKLRKAHLHGTLAQLKHERKRWSKMYHAARRLPSGPKRFNRWSQWMCIHRGEGGWTMTPPASGGPYYGGLQMNMEFMRAYGSEFLRKWGTADQWPPYVQVLVAERAYKTRGYQPWPQTSRACGLR